MKWYSNHSFLWHILVLSVSALWGENLVRNIVSRDESIVVWNRSLDKVDAFVSEIGNAVTKADTIAELIQKNRISSQHRPSRPCWKSHNRNSSRTLRYHESWWCYLWPRKCSLGYNHCQNQAEAQKHGIHWVGCGISGGSGRCSSLTSTDARREEESVRRMLPLLEKSLPKISQENRV